MISATVKINDDGHLLVSGVLSFANVAVLRAQGNELIANLSPAGAAGTAADSATTTTMPQTQMQTQTKTSQTIVVDFKEVTKCDSAALALLTAWKRMAKQNNRQIQFANLPAQLMDLAKLSNLDKILMLASS